MEAMLAIRPQIEPRRQEGADSVRVNEIYVSIQGESSHVGLLCTFIRLTGCHLRCVYCDSAFAFHEGRRMKNADIVRRARELGAPLVEVTGGEPLLQPGVYPLMEALLASGFTVLLETSGAIDVRLVPPAVHKIVDLKTPSSGECDRNDYRVLDSMNGNDELKFVIGTRDDYEWSKNIIQARNLLRRPFSLLFSPVFEKLSGQQLAEWIIQDRLPVRFQIQMHKHVWHPDARGV
jgi:7-carboxy-7-deazaguanine synthase